MNSTPGKCPACGGTWLEEGEVKGFTRQYFKPARAGMLRGYPVQACICMDCGFIGHRLEEAELVQLRHKLRGFSGNRQ